MIRIKKNIKKIISREIILYLFFGLMTTIVNFASYIFSDKLLGKEYYLISNIFSFIMATTFAFITNKQFVFESQRWNWSILVKEVVSFVSARISTFLVVEELGLLLAVRVFRINKIQFYLFDGTLMAKMVLAFLAVLLNFIWSKYLIFGNKGQ